MVTNFEVEAAGRTEKAVALGMFLYFRVALSSGERSGRTKILLNLNSFSFCFERSKSFILDSFFIPLQYLILKWDNGDFFFSRAVPASTVPAKNSDLNNVNSEF